MNKIITSNPTEIRNIFQEGSRINSNQFFTQLEVLLKIADRKEENIVFLALEEKNEIYAAGLFSIDTRRTLGVLYSTLYLYGYSFFDYNHLFIVLGFEKDFFSFVKKFSRTKGIELLILDNIRKNIDGITCVKKKEFAYCFDKNRVKEGFSFISSKKSVKRHRNKLINNFKYEVKHLIGEEIRSNLSQLEILHKERWAFDNIVSSFYYMNRLFFYDEDLENRLLTTISLNDNILAMHYGMIVENKLVWHTPVVNIQYLTFSPIEVLLTETVNFCQNNQIQQLDFGIGDEKYKARFSNTKEDLYQYYIPISFSAILLVYLSEYIKKTFSISLIKSNLRNAINKIKSMRNTLTFYYLEKKELIEQVENNDIAFKVIRNFSDFVDFCRSNQLIVRRFQHDRLRKGDYYFYLMSDNQILCDGWATSKPLYMSEINQTFKRKNAYILYDYHTHENYRRRGYYKFLLRNIVNYLDKSLYIYSLKNNKASNKAILEVGFKKIKSL